MLQNNFWAFVVSMLQKICQITKKLDADTDRRLAADLNIPEQPRYMTKYTRDKYAELPHETKKVV